MKEFERATLNQAGAAPRDVPLTDGMTIDEFLRWSKVIVRPDDVVAVNGEGAETDQVIRDGDVITVASKIIGAAVVPPGSRRDGLHVLRAFSTNVQELVVADPYLYACAPTAEAQYVADFTTATAIDAAPRALKLVCGTKVNKRARKMIHERCAALGCQVRDWITDDLHDRFWIKDSLEGQHVGASLNGLGRGRYSAISPLQAGDLVEISKFLKGVMGKPPHPPP